MSSLFSPSFSIHSFFRCCSVVLAWFVSVSSQKCITTVITVLDRCKACFQSAINCFKMRKLIFFTEFYRFHAKKRCRVFCQQEISRWFSCIFSVFLLSVCVFCIRRSIIHMIYPLAKLWKPLRFFSLWIFMLGWVEIFKISISKTFDCFPSFFCSVVNLLYCAMFFSVQPQFTNLNASKFLPLRQNWVRVMLSFLMSQKYTYEHVLGYSYKHSMLINFYVNSSFSSSKTNRSRDEFLPTLFWISARLKPEWKLLKPRKKRWAGIIGRETVSPSNIFFHCLKLLSLNGSEMIWRKSLCKCFLFLTHTSCMLQLYFSFL